jgi:hypothetical protein
MKFTVRETAKIDGGAYRWVEFADGSARVEEWRGGKWVPGGATFDEFFETPPVSPRFATELGIPLADVTIERNEPNTATAPPKLSRMDLRAVMDLGVRLAEEEALWKLAMKARHTRAAELERTMAPTTPPNGPRLPTPAERDKITGRVILEGLIEAAKHDKLNSTEERLRHAIRLGTHMAECEAMFMLGAAELDRRRAKIVHLLKARAWDLAASRLRPGNA